MLKKALFIIVIVLILLVVAIGFLYLFQNQKDLEEENTRTHTELAAMVEKLKNKPIFPIPKLPEKITFCGERVLLERDYVSERLLEALIIEINKSLDVELVFLRTGCWFPFIEQELVDVDFPLDLKYLVVIESNLNFRAYSNAGARGLWQLTNYIVRKYKGRADWWINEAYDPFRSTEIAIKHLKYLYDTLGSWASALAGYNMNSDKYAKQFKLQQAEGFYEVRKIPWQTQRFDYRAIAMKLIMENPEKYGYPSWDVINQRKYKPWNVERIKLNVKGGRKSIVDIVKDLKETYPQITYQKFVDYNHHILRDQLPPGTYNIYIPKEKK